MVGGVERKEQTILVVEDDVVTVKYAKQLLKERFTVVSAGTVRAAFDALARLLRPAAVVIDGRLPDAKGAVVVNRVHALYPDIPMLVMTGHPEDHDLANLAQSIDAEYAVKPGGSVFSFARRVVIKMHLPIDKLARRTDAVAASFGLSLCESEVLALAVAEVPVVDMPAALGVKLSTVKTHGQHIREKCDGHALHTVAWSIRSGTPLDTVDSTGL